MSTLIQPKVLKGFRDFLPAAEIQRSTLVEKITDVYRSFGFVPIDTPVLEYSEILLRKSNGETEKQVFRFTDNGGRDVALRFDLTVPFARFTAEHFSELYMPFKRYHIAKVWRGEKPQAGRYREFVQCDVDMVGSDSAAADFEILNVMKNALNAIGVNDFVIHVNSRSLFNRFLNTLELSSLSEDILRSVDKIAKIGSEQVKAELVSLSGSEEKASLILSFISVEGTFLQKLSKLEELSGGEGEDSKRLLTVYDMMCAAKIESYFDLDPSITRGLDYYTGIVFETFLTELPSIGSVCSGGRYDNLTGLYMKEKVSGVGGSIGLDRLIAAEEQLGRTQKKGSYLDVEIFCQNPSHTVYYQKIAAELRAGGVKAEVFPDAKKMGQQYALAEAKNIPWGIIVGDDDVAQGTFTLKNLKTRNLIEKCTAKKAVDTILC